MKVVNFNDEDALAIRSPGSDGNWDGDSYSMAPFISTDYKQDIVWANGLIVRWPQNWREQ